MANAEHHSTPLQGGSRWNWSAGACALLAATMYLSTLGNGFCYDDVPIVRDSPKVNAPGQWRNIWTTDYWSDAGPEWPNKDLLYRPVTISSYRMVRSLAGPKPWAQHLANIFLHAAVSAMVVAVARRLRLNLPAAFVAGGIFAVLPIHSEAVAAIVGRADLLVAAGMLVAVIAQSRAVAAAGVIRAGWTLVTASAAFVAMGAKESGVAVIPVLALWHVFLSTTTSVPAGHRDPPSGWKTLLGLSWLVIPAGAYVGLRLSALDGQLFSTPDLTRTVNILVDAPPWQRALGAVQLWGMYWSKTVIPWTLSIGYSINAIRPASGLLHPHVIAGLTASAGLVAIALWAWRRQLHAVLFAIAALLICYFPTSNTTNLIQVFFAERLWYVPAIWAALLGGWLLRGSLANPITSLALLGLLIAASVRIVDRTIEWRSNETLFAAAYRDQPDGIQPLYLYGQWLVAHGRLQEGADLLSRAVAIDLGYTDAHRALGTAYLTMNRMSEAVHHLQTAEMQAPGHKPTREALVQARSELASGHAGELAAIRSAAESGDRDATLDLIRRLRDSGQLEEALDMLARTEPDLGADAAYQTEYAVTLVLSNRLDDALARYEQAIALDPADAHRMIELAMLMLERRGPGDLDRAWQLSGQAAAIAPNSPVVLAGRAELLALRGDIAQAHAAYRAAIAGLPPGSPQRSIYQQRLRSLGG